jgi:uncharacterized glyoxalase superfamily protein PhnB
MTGSKRRVGANTVKPYKSVPEAQPFHASQHPTMLSSILSPAIPQLPSGNLQVTSDFYRERLGFTDFNLYAEQGQLIAKRGVVEIHFWQAESEVEARKYGSASSCYIRVQNIQFLYEELKARQAPFAYELKLQLWGMTERKINDPYGNAIRFGEITNV